MKETYRIRIAKGEIVTAKTSPTDSPSVVMLDWLFVPPTLRGQGWASKILRVVLDDADHDGLTVRLVSKSCAKQGGPGLGQSKLDKFYERAGFVATGEWCPEHKGNVMERRSA